MLWLQWLGMKGKERWTSHRHTIIHKSFHVYAMMQVLQPSLKERHNFVPQVGSPPGHLDLNSFEITRPEYRPFYSQARSNIVQAAYSSRFAFTPVSTAQRPAGARSLGVQNGAKWRCSQWLENSATVDARVPVDVAWAMWEDRKRIPSWMPWIKSVEVQEDDPRMSKWTLSTYQFNRQVSHSGGSKLPLLCSFQMQTDTRMLLFDFSTCCFFPCSGSSAGWLRTLRL